ncbi:MAG: GGDEF domain-containing protein [Acidobacteriota bacterium]
MQVIALSGLFADIWLSEDVAEATKSVRLNARRTLNMDARDVQEVCTTIALMTPNLSSVFEIDMNDSDMINETLEKAKETLLAVSIHSIQRVQDLQAETESLSAENQTLTHQLTRDDLTGLYNRVYFNESIDQLFENKLP